MTGESEILHSLLTSHNSLPHCLPDAKQAFDQFGELVERYLAGGVGNRLFGVRVCFEEDSVCAGGEGGAGERWHVFTLAAADTPAAPGSCTLCVASMMVGCPFAAMMLKLRMSTTRF